MIKLMVPVVRNDEMELEEFHRYWREEHPKVIKATPDSAPTIRKYVQHHTLMESYETGEPDFDGVANLWFEDLQAMEGWIEHDHYQNVVKHDEAKFLDREALIFDVYQETLMDTKPVDTDMVTMWAFLPRKRGMDPEGFHEHWRTDHAELAMATDTWDDYINRYVQNHSLNEVDSGWESTYDGIVELWFDDPADVQEWSQSDDYQQEIAPDAENFFDRERSASIVTEPTPVI